MSAKYRYKCLNENGEQVTGVIEAEDKNEAIIRLKGMYPTVRELTNLGSTESVLNVELFKKKVKAEDLALLCSQFAIILKSGTPLPECTKLMANQVPNKTLREIMTKVCDDVQAGKSLATAFERNGKKDIPTTFYETIRAGEESGNYVQSFETLSRNFSRSSRTKKKIIGALIYPFVILLVAIAVVVVMMVKVIPQLSSIFLSLGADLPKITVALINGSNFFREKYLIIIGVVVFIILAYVIFKSTDKGRHIVDSIKLKFPLLGSMRTSMASADFACNFSMLLKAGLHPTRSLLVLSRSFDNVIFKDAIAQIGKDVEVGKSIGGSMRKQECFPATLTEMVAIGDKTGELDEILDTMSEYYFNETDVKISRLLTLMEPMMLFVVAAIAIFVVVSIYLPLFKMYSYL